MREDDRRCKLLLPGLFASAAIASSYAGVRFEVVAAHVYQDGGSVDLQVEMDGRSAHLYADSSVERSAQGLFPSITLDGVVVAPGTTNSIRVRTELLSWLERKGCKEVTATLHPSNDIFYKCMSVEGFVQMMDLELPAPAP